MGAHVGHERARAVKTPRTRSSGSSRSRPSETRCLSRPRRARWRSHRRARRVQGVRSATGSSSEFRGNNHAIEAIARCPRPQFGTTHAAAAQRHGRDGRRSRARHDHAGRRADPPARHARRDPSGSRAPGQHNDEIFGELGFDADAITGVSPAPIAHDADGDDASLRSARCRTPRCTCARSWSGASRASLEGVVARRLRPVPRGAVRADGARRPRRRRDQGRARHRRRHAHGRTSRSSAASAASATSRST